jgi:hypothetical protein
MKCGMSVFTKKLWVGYACAGKGKAAVLGVLTPFQNKFIPEFRLFGELPCFFRKYTEIYMH